METNHKHTEPCAAANRIDELERALRASQASAGGLMMEVGKLRAAADKERQPGARQAATPNIDTPAFRNRVARMRNMSTERGKDDYKALVAEIHAWHTSQSARAEDAWSAEPPTEQAWYWHWNGDPEAAPFPLSVLYSGTARKCFVQMNHTYSGQAEFCDTYGGYWMRMREPANRCNNEGANVNTELLPTYAQLEAMYFAQCKKTDEWAEKARAKGEPVLQERIAELERDLATMNQRYAAGQHPEAQPVDAPLTEAELRAEFARQHKGRNLKQHHLRGTYVAAPIAALWNQHKRTAEWLMARSTGQHDAPTPTAEVTKDALSGYGPLDEALNEAAWAFVESMPFDIPGPVFNNLKQSLVAAIEKWLRYPDVLAAAHPVLGAKP